MIEQTTWSLDRLRDYRDEILETAESYDATDVRVFGSVARGDATANSDIDILVRFPSKYTLLQQSGLLMALKDLLGCDVDLSIEENLRDEYRENILRDAIYL